jgi:uncharacterized protein YerC
MQISKKKLNSTIKNQIEKIFFQMISDTNNPQDAGMIFSDFLTETEKQVITKRLAVAIYLDKGRSYQNIKDALKVSSATIASVNEKMGDPGIQLALRKIKAEQWSDDWSAKISSLVEKLVPAK